MKRRVFLGAASAVAYARPGKKDSSAGSRRKLLYGLMGDLPPRDRKISAKTVSVEEKPGYILEKLELDLNGIEGVPAWFAKPKSLRGKAPAILYNHAHGGAYKLGKDEFIQGRPAIQNPPYAEALTALGYCGCAWTPGSSASAPRARSWTYSRKCSGKARCSGA